MALSDPQFCDTCGAANRAQAQFCRVCGSSLSHTIEKTHSTLTGLLAPQAMLKKRYVVLAQAGRGGFGAVYKALDTLLGNRPVAVKEMSQSVLEAQELLAATESFKREAVMLASLSHPNLPHIYEQFTDGGRSYLVMDFIEGETLEEYLKKLGAQTMPVDKVLNTALQLCAVLEYLHTRQPPIIFRDLKPGNVMLTPKGHVYLIDFGIARHFKPGQKTDTTALGSSGYAPPEQYGKSQTTLRADIYSLGATLHQLLSSDDPSESPFHFAPLHLSDPVLDGLEALVMSMVSVEINKRPESIMLVRQELHRIMARYMLKRPQEMVDSLSGTIPVPLPPITTNIAHTPAPTSYQAAATQTTPRKKLPKQNTQPQVYPQVNTLFICLGHTSRITAVAWSPDGKYLASASYDKTVQVWNASNGSHILTYKGHSGRVNALAWSPDSKNVVSVSDDRTAQVWQASTGDKITAYTQQNASITAVAWSADGKQIASAGADASVQIWDAGSGGVQASYLEHSDKIHSLAWSPDGNFLASGGKDCKLKIRELQKTQQKRSFWSTLITPHYGQKTFGSFKGQINALAWSPDSKRIGSVSSDYTVRIHDVFHNTVYSLGESWNTLKNSIAWSPTGKHLALGGNDTVVRIWNVANKKETFVYHGHTNYVTTVAWSPDGTRIASAGVDRTLQVWQAL